MKDYYSGIAEGYDHLHKEEQLEKLSVIAKHLKVKAPLLDIGAGTGISTAFFKAKAVALDPSRKMLEKYDGEKVCGKAEALPFKDNSFGTVISVTALHHADIEKAIAEIRRVAKKDATFAFTILKKARCAKEIKERLKKAFGLKEYDSEKDFILVS